jgi:hypothetical protein
MITGLTGNAAGAKSYYAIKSGLKKCQGSTETILCMLVHPMVGMTPPPNSSHYTSVYQSSFIYALRNPISALPYHFSYKGNKYHNIIGQINEEEWRLFRDQYIDRTLSTFIKQLTTWKDLTYYHVGLYLTYEHLMDYRTGPTLVAQLGALLHSLGFDSVIPIPILQRYDLNHTVLTPSNSASAPDDITLDQVTCTWFRAIGETALQQYQQYRFEYNDYIPGYTQQQQQYIVQQLQSLQANYSTDYRLSQILDQYIYDIQHHTRIDRPWENHTTSLSP